MERGEMLKALDHIETTFLPKALSRFDGSGWKTKLVTYETPHVERLYQDVGDLRVYLHRILPCQKALFHPHPWPSAVHVIHGGYVMDVGYGKGLEPPPVAATISLPTGSKYEMIDVDGWHAVKPPAPSFSIMVSHKPWDRPSTGKGQPHQELSLTKARNLWIAFAGYRHYQYVSETDRLRLEAGDL